jgi:serine protease AprX
VKPDIVAPGVNITSLRSDIEFIPENNRKKYKFKTMEEPYTEMSGTSMATPMVSGGIALLLEKEPKLTPNEIKKKLMNTAISLKENRYAQGKGQISLKNFL